MSDLLESENKGSENNGLVVAKAMLEAFYQWQFENQYSLSCRGYGNLVDLSAKLSAATP